MAGALGNGPREAMGDEVDLVRLSKRKAVEEDSVAKVAKVAAEGEGAIRSEGAPILLKRRLTHALSLRDPSPYNLSTVSLASILRALGSHSVENLAAKVTHPTWPTPPPCQISQAVLHHLAVLCSG